MWGEVDLSAGAHTQGGKRHQIPMELVTGSHKLQDVGAWNQTLESALQPMARPCNQLYIVSPAMFLTSFSTCQAHPWQVFSVSLHIYHELLL